MDPNPIWLVTLQEEEIRTKWEKHVKHRENMAFYKPKKEPSEATNPADTFILNF